MNELDSYVDIYVLDSLSIYSFHNENVFVSMFSTDTKGECHQETVS